MAATYKGKSMKPGGGGAFARFVDELMAEGKSKEAAQAIAASAGRRRYGKNQFQAMASAGRRRAMKAAMTRMAT